MLEYANIPRSIGAVVSHRLATLIETQTVYGIEDVYNLLEIANIDAHNTRLLRKAEQWQR